MGRRVKTRLLTIGLLLLLLPTRFTQGQGQTGQSEAHVAAYQLGVVAQAKPGAQLTYSIIVTNYGPSSVNSFYLEDGWTINSGIAAFVSPVSDPAFGKFTLAGTWQQVNKDQKLLAWLLNGELAAGDTIRFDWKVSVDSAYNGELINWARVVSNGIPTGDWQPRAQTTSAPPAISNPIDPDDHENRTPDGVTTVSESPDNQGVDLAVYQVGLLTELKKGKPLTSTWLVANLGPQPVKQFYVLAGWSLGPDGKSVLTQPVSEPDFAGFTVVGRWKQTRPDEERWLWLLSGNLDSGGSAAINWSRALVADYEGDLLNWVHVSVKDVPDGDWLPRGDTTTAPKPLDSEPDTDPKNDRSTDGLTTVTG